MVSLHGLKTVFMGTAEFAVPSLRALAEAGCDIRLVVTRPDKPRGRGLDVCGTPVKCAAESLGLEVFQPPGLRDEAVRHRLKECGADFFVVAAYGRILPPDVLAMPKYGCVNVHGSILPAYRGAAPIQWAVINGEKETGITIMLMDEGCDTGPVLLIGRTAIGPTDTTGIMFERLSTMGPPLLLEAMEGLLKGTIVPSPQDHSRATSAPMIDKSIGAIDWNSSSESIESLVRGADPWPGTFTDTPSGARLRILPFVAVLPSTCSACGLPVPPGTVIRAGVGRDGESRGDGMVVRTGDGAVFIDSVQPACARRMTPAAMVAGRRLSEGDMLHRSES